ncbi:MAG: prolyl oligopeptidase family serine peptidase [Bacteroidota bacterium]
MIEYRNIVLERDDNLPVLIDVFSDEGTDNKSVVIFSHGYKGYKDWGAWNQVAKEFAKAGFIFVKFNFSHNGGTIENPIDFPDLEAFGKNTYSKELNDLGFVIDEIVSNDLISSLYADLNRIYIIGHSRGGGISLLKAAQDKRVKKLCTWASVSDFESRFPRGEDMKKWKEKGIMYVLNGRTKQEMPHYFQFYEDFVKNEKTLNISGNLQSINIPTLIIHGKDDKSVNFSEAEFLHENIRNSELIPIENTEHTFDVVHPWNEVKLPKAMAAVVKLTIDFLSRM